MGATGFDPDVAIVGLGAVGRATAAAMVQRIPGVSIALLDQNEGIARSVAIDLDHAVSTSVAGGVRAASYEELGGCRLVIVAAGINEKDGGATDRSDPLGRLRLLDTNVPVILDIVDSVVAHAPDAVLLIVTNPPDALADIARTRAGHGRVMSSGTSLDSIRFRTYLAHELGVHPRDVSANVYGEHGTSSVLHWSQATVGGVALRSVIASTGITLEELKDRVEPRVRQANLDIIEGLGASQFGVGAVVSRLAEAVLRNERTVMPVGSWQPGVELTYSLPSVIGESGVVEVFEPDLDQAEQEALERSIAALRSALDRAGRDRG